MNIDYIMITSLIVIITVIFFFRNKKMNQEHEIKILKHNQKKIKALSNYKEASKTKNNITIKSIIKNMTKLLILATFLFSSEV